MQKIHTSLISNGNDWEVTITVSNPEFNRRFDNAILAVNIFEAVIGLLVRKNQSLHEAAKKVPCFSSELWHLHSAFSQKPIELTGMKESIPDYDYFALSFLVKNCQEIALPGSKVIPFTQGEKVA